MSRDLVHSRDSVVTTANDVMITLITGLTVIKRKLR